jgi:hypothetical protein
VPQLSAGPLGAISRMKRSHKSNISRYLRTSWRLCSSATLRFPEYNAFIRTIAKDEAESLNKEAQRNNAFIRYPHGNPFYPVRILKLSDKTVIEIFRTGRPSEIGESLDSLASLIEIIVLSSSIMNTSRTQFHNKLAIGKNIRKDHDITIGPGFKSFRSRSKRERIPKGISIDSRFITQFQENGFNKLIQYCQSDSDLSQRVVSALNWLIDSRQETNLSAAFVKTSIALESLFIFNDNEPLTRSLSERCAFILSSYPHIRAKVSQIVRDFYDARSGIVHGGRRKSESLSSNLLELVDRIIVLLILTLAANDKKWTSKDGLRDWCEYQKWDAPDIRVIVPFSERYIKSVLNYSK